MWQRSSYGGLVAPEVVLALVAQTFAAALEAEVVVVVEQCG